MIFICRIAISFVWLWCSFSCTMENKDSWGISAQWKIQQPYSPENIRKDILLIKSDNFKDNSYFILLSKVNGYLLCLTEAGKNGSSYISTDTEIIDGALSKKGNIWPQLKKISEGKIAIIARGPFFTMEFLNNAMHTVICIRKF